VISPIRVTPSSSSHAPLIKTNNCCLVQAHRVTCTWCVFGAAAVTTMTFRTDNSHSWLPITTPTTPATTNSSSVTTTAVYHEVWFIIVVSVAALLALILVTLMLVKCCCRRPQVYVRQRVPLDDSIKTSPPSYRYHDNRFHDNRVLQVLAVVLSLACFVVKAVHIALPVHNCFLSAEQSVPVTWKPEKPKLEISN